MTDARWFIVVMALGLVLTVGTGIASCALGHTSKSTPGAAYRPVPHSERHFASPGAPFVASA